jgi:hypothetical protein
MYGSLPLCLNLLGKGTPIGIACVDSSRRATNVRRPSPNNMARAVHASRVVLGCRALSSLLSLHRQHPRPAVNVQALRQYKQVHHRRQSTVQQAGCAAGVGRSGVGTTRRPLPDTPVDDAQQPRHSCRRAHYSTQRPISETFALTHTRRGAEGRQQTRRRGLARLLTPCVILQAHGWQAAATVSGRWCWRGRCRRRRRCWWWRRSAAAARRHGAAGRVCRPPRAAERQPALERPPYVHVGAGAASGSVL